MSRNILMTCNMIEGNGKKMTEKINSIKNKKNSSKKRKISLICGIHAWFSDIKSP